jgi:hypothetical protein
MARPFYDRLAEYYSDLAAGLRGEAKLASIFANPSDIGDSREKIYIEFLRRHVPANCEVMQGGFLFDMEGNESSQIDVIVSSNASLRFALGPPSNPRTFACVEGTVAVASLKSNLTAENLRDAIQNIASIPPTQSVEGRHNLLTRIKNYENFPFKIVYAPKGATGETVKKVVNEALKSIPINRFPDIIHVAGQYAFIKCPENLRTDDGTVMPANVPCFVTGRADLQAMVFATTEIQSYAVATQRINFNYSDLIWGLVHASG